MKIQSVSIDGFRSIREMNFKTNGNLQIIIGKNDTGKSNILRALDLFFNNSIDKEPLNWDRDFNITYKKARGKNVPICITIKIEFRLNKLYSSSNLYKKLMSVLGESFIVSKKIYFNRQELFYSKNEFSLYKNKIDENNKTLPILNDFFSYIHFFYIPINKDEDWIKKSYIFNDIKNRFIDAWGKGGESQKSISTLKKDINTMLKKIKDTVDDGMSEITTDFRNLFPEYVKVTFQTPKDANDLFRLLEIEVLSENNISTTLGVRGSGVQSASIPLLLYYVDTGKTVSARTSLYFPIWAIEEPESFQHDDLEQKISQFFYDKIQKKIPVFITTHSSYYLAPGNIENIHLCKLEKSVSVITEECNDWSKYFFEISNELGYNNLTDDILQVLKKDKDTSIIILEGKYDIEIFNKICSIDTKIKKKFSKFVPIDGEGSNLPTKVKLLEKAQKNILVILDDDKDGNAYKNQLDKLQSKFLKIHLYSNSRSSTNNVLESLIPEEIRSEFKLHHMTDEAISYWYSSGSKIEQEIYKGVTHPPKGWDKNELKNNLCDFYVKNYHDAKYFKDFIDFYNQIIL